MLAGFNKICQISLDNGIACDFIGGVKKATAECLTNF
jgi:hypothetical protein